MQCVKEINESPHVYLKHTVPCNSDLDPAVHCKIMPAEKTIIYKIMLFTQQMEMTSSLNCFVWKVPIVCFCVWPRCLRLCHSHAWTWF